MRIDWPCGYVVRSRPRRGPAFWCLFGVIFEGYWGELAVACLSGALGPILSEAFSKLMGLKKLVWWEYPIFGHVFSKLMG